MKNLILIASWLTCVYGRPDLPVGNGFPGGNFGGGPGGGVQLDSYAAPIGGGGNVGSGGYSNGPAPQYGPPQQAPVIHKHVYVHVPPPEPTSYTPKRPIAPPPPPQKHYKIVFIKAPTPPPPVVPEIPAIAPPAEQKTLIYVLVKKPDEAPEINIPTPQPTQPSKPEVYFIRYKTQKQEGYPNSVGSEYGAPPPSAVSGPSAPGDSYGAPPQSPGGSFGSSPPSNQYGPPNGSPGQY